MYCGFKLVHYPLTAPRLRAAAHPDHQWRLSSPRRVSKRFFSLGRVVYGIYTGCHVKRIHYRDGDAVNQRIDNLCPWTFEIAPSAGVSWIAGSGPDSTVNTVISRPTAPVTAVTNP